MKEGLYLSRTKLWTRLAFVAANFGVALLAFVPNFGEHVTVKS